MEPRPLALRVQSLNHWTTREVPLTHLIPTKIDYSHFTDEKLRQRMIQCLTKGHITNRPTASNMNLDPESISGPLFSHPPPCSPTCPVQSRLSLLTHTQTEHICSLGFTLVACGLLLFPPYHMIPFI